MSYSSGAVSSPNQFLETLAAFADAQGWTINMNAVNGSGRRLHIERDGVYVNLISDSTNTITLYGSSGFNGALGASSQPAPISSSRTLTNLSGLFPATYHLFAHTGPALIAGVLVSSTNNVRYFAAGNLNKFGTYTGGQFYATNFMNINGQPTPITLSSTSLKVPSGFIDSVTSFQSSILDSKTGLAPLLPLPMFEFISSNSSYLPRGQISTVKNCHALYNNGTEVSYGSDVYKVFYHQSLSSRGMVAFRK